MYSLATDGILENYQKKGCKLHIDGSWRVWRINSSQREGGHLEVVQWLDTQGVRR